MFGLRLRGYGLATLLCLYSVSSREDAPVLMMVGTFDRKYHVVRGVLIGAEDGTPIYEARGPVLTYYSRVDAEISFEIDLKQIIKDPETLVSLG